MPSEDQLTEFNMGVLSIQRINNFIVTKEQYEIAQFQNGNPLLSIVLRLQKVLYKELYPYLTEDEAEEAQEYFKILRDNPIINDGSRLIVPAVTEEMIDRFDLWLMKKLFDKGILTKLGDDPWAAMI